VGNEGRPDKPDRKNEYLRANYRAIPKITLNGRSIDDILKMSSKVRLTKEVGHADKVEIECYGVIDVDADTDRIVLSIIDPATGSTYNKKYVLLNQDIASLISSLSFDIIYKALEDAKRLRYDIRSEKELYDKYDRELEKIDKILWKKE